MKEELEMIEILAKNCDDDLALELNRRLQEIIDWVITVNLEYRVLKKEPKA